MMETGQGPLTLRTQTEGGVECECGTAESKSHIPPPGLNSSVPLCSPAGNQRHKLLLVSKHLRAPPKPPPMAWLNTLARSALGVVE